MDKLNYNKILNRENISNKIIDILNHFNNNKNDLSVKRGIYIYGESGCGKTFFINNLLRKLNYDIIYFDSSDSRNKSILDIITKYNMGTSNILSLFKKEKRNIAIIMDEIDGMNNGDKGGINSLIKFIRPKKTKKQKTEEITNNIIICISNYQVDKKIKELMKICQYPNYIMIWIY
jgi:Cdc6-like AAA superfamily ATPase